MTFQIRFSPAFRKVCYTEHNLNICGDIFMQQLPRHLQRVGGHTYLDEIMQDNMQQLRG